MLDYALVVYSLENAEQKLYLMITMPSIYARVYA